MLSSPPIKLKICLGNKKAQSTSEINSSTRFSTPQENLVPKDTLYSKSSKAVTHILTNKQKGNSSLKRKIKSKSTFQQEALDSDESAENDAREEKEDDKWNHESDSDCDEEEKWLNAIESGNYGSLDQIDSELKNIKDPKLMTARQRAMVSGVGGRYVTVYFLTKSCSEC